MVKDDGARGLLYQLDQSIIKLRSELGDRHAAVLELTAVYHNLLRRWAEV
jgi:PKHD-type hydroxylase